MQCKNPSDDAAFLRLFSVPPCSPRGGWCGRCVCTSRARPCCSAGAAPPAPRGPSTRSIRPTARAATRPATPGGFLTNPTTRFTCPPCPAPPLRAAVTQTRGARPGAAARSRRCCSPVPAALCRSTPPCPTEPGALSVCVCSKDNEQRAKVSLWKA